jgi:Bacterial membrane protein YfhO
MKSYNPFPDGRGSVLAASDSRLTSRFAGPGLLLIICVLFHWKLVLTNQYTWLEAADLGSLILPWFQLQAGEWHQWRFPMWDPYSWAGQPLFGQAQPGAAYPINWLLFWMPLNHGWLRQDVLHWFYVLVHYLAGLTAYALCRDLGRSRLASVLGGVIYSLAGYVAYTDSPQMLHGAVWAPLVFLYLFRVERGENRLASAVLSGFFLGVTWLAGHHQMQIFLSLAVAGMWLWLVASSQKPAARVVWLAVVAFGMTGLTSAFQTLPAAEFGRQAVRWVGAEEPQGLGETVPYAVHAQYSLKPISLIGIFIPGVEHGSFDAFCGVVALTFGILGAVLAWRQRQVRWLATIALCGILFALGGNSVFHGMFYALAPLVEKARVPAAATLLFAVGLAPLAAFGLDGVKAGASGTLRIASWVLAGFGAVLAFGVLFFYAARVPMAISDNRLMIPALSAILAAGLLIARFSGRARAFAAIGLLLFEIGNVTDYNLATADRATHPYLYTLADHFDLARYVRGQGEPARVVYDTKAIDYNIGDWYGIETVNAYAASVPSSLWQHQVFSARVQDIMGVRYYFGVTPQRTDLQEVFQGRSGVKVFENAKAFPRAWAVHRGLEVADVKEARGILADPQFDARHEVFLVGQSAPKLADCGDDDVWMPRHEPNYVEIKAAMNCRGMVILTDTWFPGWRATVDGHAAGIEKAYGAFRGVVVEAGEHTIEMRYRPWSVFVGAGLTGIGGMIALFMAARVRWISPPDGQGSVMLQG